jgi:hypothetical protein
MESYGFDSVLSQGNQHNQSILRANEEIRKANAERLVQRQNDITNLKDSQSNLMEGQEKGLAETIGGQVASKGKDIQVLPKVAQALPDVGRGVVRATEKFGIGGLDALTEGVSRQIPKVFGQTARATGELGVGAKSSFGNLFKSDEELAKGGDLAAQFRVADAASSGDGLKDLGNFLKSNVSVGESIGQKASSIGKLGLASTGLSIGMGALDAIDDIESGKIEGNNTAEKVSNVAGMASGGLEALGTALDLTGVGAPVGVALNLLGGLAGLAGGVSDIVGEEQEKEKAKTQQTALQKAPVPQEKLQALSDVGSSGAMVKSAQ